MPLKHKGYSAQINSDGRELEPYNVEVERDKTVNGWIASDTGKTFSVQWHDRSASTNMTVSIFMDGQKMGWWIHRRGDDSLTVSGVHESRDCERPFTFVPLAVTDDDAVANAREKHDALGTIEVRMTRVAGFEPYKENDGGHVVDDEVAPVHEKSKKAGVHRVSLGAKKRMRPVKFWNVLGEERKPFLVFVFRYRPRAILQAMEIVPRSPRGKKRGANEGDHDSDDSDEDEDRANFLEEQIVLLQSQLDREESKRKKARTGSDRELSVIDILGDEIIDLTTDDE